MDEQMNKYNKKHTPQSNSKINADSSRTHFKQPKFSHPGFQEEWCVLKPNESFHFQVIVKKPQWLISNNAQIGFMAFLSYRSHSLKTAFQFGSVSSSLLPTESFPASRKRNRKHPRAPFLCRRSFQAFSLEIVVTRWKLSLFGSKGGILGTKVWKDVKDSPGRCSSKPTYRRASG